MRSTGSSRSTVFRHLGTAHRTALGWRGLDAKPAEDRRAELTADYAGVVVRALEDEGDLEAGKTYTLHFDCEVRPTRCWALFYLSPEIGAVGDVLAAPQALPSRPQPFQGTLRIRVKTKLRAADLPALGWWVVLN